MKHFILLVLGVLSFACAKTTTERLGLPVLQTVPTVEVNRYLGTWYEISSFPQRFQKGCNATTANYSLRSDGEIEVINRCNKDALNGPEDVAQGRARVVDKTTNARLEVSFFRPFWGDYWIIDLGENYEYAVVGNPSRDYLWILSRTPTLEAAIYDGILERLTKQGYEPSRLVLTAQKSSPSSQP
jgi:apolipoprotein D and lipocalin family protein